jgi:hypothetical protein
MDMKRVQTFFEEPKRNQLPACLFVELFLVGMLSYFGSAVHGTTTSKENDQRSSFFCENKANKKKTIFNLSKKLKQII